MLSRYVEGNVVAYRRERHILFAPFPEIRTFIDRHCGYHIFMEILSRLTISPSGASGTISISDVGDKFLMSRAHVRKLLKAATERNWLTYESGGRITIGATSLSATASGLQPSSPGYGVARRWRARQTPRRTRRGTACAAVSAEALGQSDVDQRVSNSGAAAPDASYRPLRARRLYGDLLMGLSEIPSRCALLRIAAGGRPSFRLSTPVGVLSFASCLSCFTSAPVHGSRARSL